MTSIEYSGNDSTTSRERAKEANLGVVVPRPDELQIDIDTDAEYLKFKLLRDMMLEHIQVKKCSTSL